MSNRARRQKHKTFQLLRRIAALIRANMIRPEQK